MPNFPFDTHAYVSALLAREGIPYAGGSVYFLNPGHTNANDGNDGWDPNHPLLTLAEAEDRCTANQHDVIFYVGMDAGITLTSALTWDKDYTHLVGLVSPTRIAQRARIFCGADDLSPFITISASGCTFKNIYIFQGRDDADSLLNVQLTGGRNYFENVHFAGGGNATQAVDGGASLALGGSGGSCEENTFVRCTVGVDTADAATGMMCLLFNGSEAHRNEFKECTFRIRAGNTGAGFVELVTTAAAIDRDTVFDNCFFINNSTSNDIASAFVIPATSAGEPRSIHLKDCYFHNTTKLDGSDRGMLFGNMPVLTAGDTSGLAKELIS